MADQNEGVEGQEEGEDFTSEAKALGWIPEEEFQGDKERFIPAKEFVEKGRHVVPILQQNNKRLQKELLTRDQKIGKLQQDLQSLNTQFGEVEKKLSKVDQAAYARAKAELTVSLKEARAQNDVDAEVEIQDKIASLRKAEDVGTEKKPTVAAESATIQLDPAIQAWMNKNPWFGDQTSTDNKKKTKEFLRIGEDMREDGYTGSMEQFCADVEQEYAKRHPVQRLPSKVEGGGRASNGGGSGGTGGKSYANLPADAKAACMEFAETLVGPNKRYKKLEDFQKQYAANYHEGEQ